MRGWIYSIRGRLGLVEWNTGILADKGMENSENYIDFEREFIGIVIIQTNINNTLIYNDHKHDPKTNNF